MSPSFAALLLSMVAASHAPSGRAPIVNACAAAHAARAPAALRAGVRRDGLMRAEPTPCGPLAQPRTTVIVGIHE